MSDTGVLQWLNEHAKTDYPLENSIGYTDFIVDASFVQFDNYIPVLKSIVGTITDLTLSIQFDKEKLDIVLAKESFVANNGIRITGTDTRYLGTIVFGPGTLDVFTELVGLTKKYNQPFAATTVTSINSNAGVYTIEDVWGDVTISTGESQTTQEIFFQLSGNTVVWNAVGLPEIPTVDFVPLRSINGVHATNHAVFFQDTSIIHVEPGSFAITFSLVGDSNNINPIANYQ